MASMAKRRRKENVAEPTPKITWKEIKRQKVLIFWSLIIVIYGIIFYYLPLGGWVMAFEDYKPKDGLFHSAFVGLANFEQLFSDVTFVRVIRNTLAMGVINLAATFIMAIVFAILLNEVQSKGGKKVVQTISYLPHFLSWIIVTGILHDALSGSGIINELLVGLHLIDEPINFFAHTKYFWPIVAFANVWKETGWNAIIYLAAITSIDPSLYEAASMDGAGRWSQMRFITLPALANTIITVLILNLAKVMNLFESVFVLQNDAVIQKADVLQTYIYTQTFNSGTLPDFGYTTAVSLVSSLVGCALVLICNRASYKVRGRGIV